MTGTAPLSFDQASGHDEGLVQGTPFARVEDAIDAAGFSHLHKAALCLLAWSLRDPTAQRRDARLMAEACNTDGENQPLEQNPLAESPRNSDQLLPVGNRPAARRPSRRRDRRSREG